MSDDDGIGGVVCAPPRAEGIGAGRASTLPRKRKRQDSIEHTLHDLGPIYIMAVVSSPEGRWDPSFVEKAIGACVSVQS